MRYTSRWQKTAFGGQTPESGGGGWKALVREQRRHVHVEQYLVEYATAHGFQDFARRSTGLFRHWEWTSRPSGIVVVTGSQNTHSPTTLDLTLVLHEDDRG